MSYMKRYVEAIVEKLEENRAQGQEVKVGMEIEVECETASGKRSFRHHVTADDLLWEKQLRNP